MDSSYFSRLAVVAPLLFLVSFFASIDGCDSILSKFVNWAPMERVGTVQALAIAGLLVTTVGAVLNRIVSGLMRRLGWEPDRYEFLGDLKVGLLEDSSNQQLKDLDPIDVYHLLFYSDALKGFAEWRQRRRIQMYFNAECILAIVCGWGVGWIFGPHRFTTAFVITSVAASVTSTVLFFLAKRERKFDKGAVQAWIKYYIAHTKNQSPKPWFGLPG